MHSGALKHLIQKLAVRFDVLGRLVEPLLRCQRPLIPPLQENGKHDRVGRNVAQAVLAHGCSLSLPAPKLVLDSLGQDQQGILKLRLVKVLRVVMEVDDVVHPNVAERLPLIHLVLRDVHSFAGRPANIIQDLGSFRCLLLDFLVHNLLLLDDCCGALAFRLRGVRWVLGFAPLAALDLRKLSLQRNISHVVNQERVIAGSSKTCK